MENKISLSIIIPVYNVQAYLPECLDSILSQNADEYEIILVDDGSTDRSGEICNKYAERYSHIQVIHKENGGLSSARNAGLRISSGNYISFIDSDDRIAAGSMHAILEWISDNDADLCFMEAVKFFPDGTTQSLNEQIQSLFIKGKTNEEVLMYLSGCPKFPGSACTKIFSRLFLQDNELQFPNDRRYSEDLGFCLQCFLCAKRFDKLEIPYYEYRQNREGSQTYFISKKSFDGLSLFVRESTKALCNNKMPKNASNRALMSFVAYEYSIVLWYLMQFQGEDRLTIYDFLRTYRWVLCFGASRKLKVIDLMTRILGINNASALLGKYMKMRR